VKFIKSKEFKVGILVVAGLIFFYWGFNFLKGTNFLSGKRIFYATYNSINGLVEANNVEINGVKVGAVNEISFINIKGKVLVKFAVENNIKIPRNSIASIYSSDVLGSKALEIKLGDSSVMAKSGDTLKSAIQPSITEQFGYELLPFKRKAENLMASLDSAIDVIQAIFNDKTRDNLKHSFESIKNSINSFEHIAYNIDTIVSTQRNRLTIIFANIESISSNLKNNNSKLTNIINNFSNISDSLSKAKIIKVINNTNDALKNFSDISEKINKGQGSLGLLINNDSLYKELNNSSKELNLLLEDIRLNPQNYVHFSIFGKNTKKN
jgi:phospholipid/cholesterol/gamma-HCH transport system substrate-binding protein